MYSACLSLDTEYNIILTSQRIRLCPPSSTEQTKHQTRASDSVPHTLDVSLLRCFVFVGSGLLCIAVVILRQEGTKMRQGISLKRCGRTRAPKTPPVTGKH